MKNAVAALALLALAACGDGAAGGGAARQNVTSIQAESVYLEKLRALSPQNRDLALRRAIQDSGKTCKRIESTEEAGTYKNMATWTAHCEGGLDWAIFIAPNGDAQVRSCGHVEELGLPACRTKAQ